MALGGVKIKNGAAMVCCQNRVLNEIALVVGKCGFAKLMRQPETQFSVAKWSGGGSLPKECVEQGCVGCWQMMFCQIARCRN